MTNPAGHPDPEDSEADDAEPDYRFTLANERTFLAWVRTALAFLAAAVAVVQLVPPFGAPWGRRALGVSLAAVSIACALGGMRRWQVVQAAMRAGRPLPASRLPWVVTAAVVATTATVAVLLAGSGAR